MSDGEAETGAIPVGLEHASQSAPFVRRTGRSARDWPLVVAHALGDFVPFLMQQA